MKRKQKRILGKGLAYVFQISLALIFVLPLVWMIISSLKPEADLFKDMSSIATFFVSNPSLDNYKEMLSRSLVLKSTMNSIIYIGLILLIGIPVNALCGYALAFFGYEANVAQTVNTLNGIHIMYSIIPGIIAVCSIISLRRYNLTEKEYEAILEDLNKDEPLETA